MQISHQFNQGTNAIELIKSDDGAVENLRQLIKGLASTDVLEEMLKPLDSKKFRVIFAIITHKDKGGKSNNLPLFSRISLMRVMRMFCVMSVEAAFGFVEDKSPKKAGKKKSKKEKK